MVRLLPFIESDGFTFLDLCAGMGSAARSVLDLYPHSTAVLAEFSPQMIVEGARELALYNDRYVESDMLTGVWPNGIPINLDVVITSISIHHMPHLRKQGLFVEIYEPLVPGGWYFNYGPVRRSTDEETTGALGVVGARKAEISEMDPPLTDCVGKEPDLSSDLASGHSLSREEDDLGALAIAMRPRLGADTLVEFTAVLFGQNDQFHSSHLRPPRVVGVGDFTTFIGPMRGCTRTRTYRHSEVGSGPAPTR